MMARGAEPRLGDRKGKDPVPTDARPLGDLYEGILGQLRQKSPALGMLHPAVERTTAHPEPLEGVADPTTITLCRSAEPPVHDVGGHDRGDEGPDVIPECLAAKEEVGLCKPGGGLGIEAGIGLRSPLPPEAMLLRDVDEILPQGCEGRRGNWSSAGCGITDLVGKVVGTEPDPA
jgi:hypothetical protein